MDPEAADATFIPALRLRALTKLYDRLMALTFPDQELKRRLVDQAAVLPGQRVLDVGCGTGTLAVLTKQTVPGAEVVGLDADEEVLAMARAKAAHASVDLTLYRALAKEADLPAASFDRVVSSLFFHHIRPEDKVQVLRRVHDLLRPGGELHLLDWSRPQDPLMRLAFLSVRLLDGFGPTRAHAQGKVPQLLEEAGFVDVAEVARRRTVFGTMALFRARRADIATRRP
jgi:cyclopropane fatty-acyl-phospholipid synthase-like methyltransferase